MRRLVDAYIRIAQLQDIPPTINLVVRSAEFVVDHTDPPSWPTNDSNHETNIPGAHDAWLGGPAQMVPSRRWLDSLQKAVRSSPRTERATSRSV